MALLLAVLMLAGCGSDPPPEPVLVRPEVPRSLLEPTPPPPPLMPGSTIRDVVGLALDLQGALGACNADKAAVREIVAPAE